MTRMDQVHHQRHPLGLNVGVLHALAAAMLFGISTPAAKRLVGEVPPVLLAGLLYLGSGLGLGGWCLLYGRCGGDDRTEAPLCRRDMPWLVGAVLCGGVIAPVLLMVGLATTSGAMSSLLLNLEGALTAVIAWYVFHENFSRRVVLGVAAIVAGGVVLSWGGLPRGEVPSGPLAVAAACLFWAMDNNLTKKVSGSAPVQIAAIKGLVAGVVNVSIGLILHPHVPPMGSIVLSGLVGLAGYGISLVLFVLALRRIGTARTAAYFSVGPFSGAVASIPILGESMTWPLVAAGGLMALGVYLHLTESHQHEHIHQAVIHSHGHVHDEHHSHEHPDAAREPHAHPHAHAPTRHTHPHYPDLHHTHQHDPRESS
jgi:drug/metabolite transporter (DMT)-like permease